LCNKIFPSYSWKSWLAAKFSYNTKRIQIFFKAGVHNNLSSLVKLLCNRKSFSLWTLQMLSILTKENTILQKKHASPENRTRINCLEGNYADHYTRNAWCLRQFFFANNQPSKFSMLLLFKIFNPCTGDFDLLKRTFKWTFLVLFR
jgi:hypothetical protein